MTDYLSWVVLTLSWNTLIFVTYQLNILTDNNIILDLTFSNTLVYDVKEAIDMVVPYYIIQLLQLT